MLFCETELKFKVFPALLVKLINPFMPSVTSRCRSIYCHKKNYSINH